MNLKQLRYVVEIVKNSNHLSAAAEALNTSQPGVSRQIQLLEAELGFAIFVRANNRFTGLTEGGEHVFAIAQRALAEVNALRALKEDMGSGGKGNLIVATTHTQARYFLPPIIEGFMERHPNVRLTLKQGDPAYACELVGAGEADLAIGAEPIRVFPQLISLPCAELKRSVIAKAGHPILEVEPLTLQEIASHPIVTYDRRYSGHWIVMQAFEQAGLEPKIMLSAVDADVCKAYVESGLGIAILSSLTFDPKRDADLRMRDASHLFPSSVVNISLRANTYLRPIILDFVRAVAPHLTPRVVSEAMLAAAATAKAD
ncbi:LysR substrate-binding domain-containing protein [Aquabacter sp. CN5-332]|uniref:LysR substrate-binding domain-containing protein n=1 Tax=Aquabacter sp. CN5-332 TaxID=3156608 RepID=UPI0032B3EF13